MRKVPTCPEHPGPMPFAGAYMRRHPDGRTELRTLYRCPDKKCRNKVVEVLRGDDEKETKLKLDA